MASQTFDSDLIDHIVREVIRRLLNRGVDVRGDANQTNGSELTMCEPVITLASIEGRLDGVQKVVLESRAVVTPAARDALREKGVEIARR